MHNILTQICMILAYLILGYALLTKPKNEILKASIIFNILMTVYYFLIGGIAGAISCIIAMLRSVYFRYNEEKGKKNSLLSLVIFWFIVIASNYLVYSAPNDLVVVALSLVGVFSFWYNGFEKLNKSLVIKFGQAFVGACYIIYAITIQAWLIIPFEAVLFIGGTLGGFKWIKNKNSVNS